MQSKEKDNLIFVRLFPNEDIYAELRNVCVKHNIQTGLILSGLGQLKNFRLGYFREEGDYMPEEFEKAHELLALTGNIVKQEQDYEFHIHATLGNEKKEVVGGHLIEGKVSVTNEIVLLKTGLEFQRGIDEETGLKGMILE